MTRPSMRPHLALALLVPLLAAAPLRAQTEAQYSEARGVRVEARYDWPGALQRGYFPIALRIRNEADEPRRVVIEARPQWGSNDRFVERLDVAPGALEEAELLLRARLEGVNAHILEVTIGGEEAQAILLGPDEWRAIGKRSLVVAVPEPSVAPDAERWERSLGSSRHSVAVVAPTRLSPSFESYTSLDGVVLDVTAGLPERGRREALAAWVRLGGSLLLCGQGATERARADDLLAPWLEERFLVTERRGGRVYAMGQGRLALVDEAPRPEGDPLGPAAIELLKEELGDARTREDWVPRQSGSRSGESRFATKPYAELPLRALTALLVLFAIVIGPVNFVLVRRSGRPTLLLLTVPGIALVTALALLGYGIFHQGLGVDVVRETWTLLDQRSARAEAVEVRELFAGSSPGPGLRPGPGTAVFVDEPRDLHGLDGGRSYRADYGDGVLLSGSYLPVRDPVRHVTLTGRTARGRLELRRSGGEVEVGNALGADVLELVLHDADGSWYRSEAALPEGREARLVAIDPEAGRAATERLEQVVLGQDTRGLPRGTYAARLAGAPFVDDCGIEFTEVAGVHHLLGVLASEEGGPR